MSEQQQPLAWIVVGRVDGSEVRIVREDVYNAPETVARFADGGPYDGPDVDGAEWWYYGGEAFGSAGDAAAAVPIILCPTSWRRYSGAARGGEYCTCGKCPGRRGAAARARIKTEREPVVRAERND